MKISTVILVCALLSPSVSFAGSLSNPALSIPVWKSTIGVEYFHESQNFKPKDSSSAFNNAALEMNQFFVRGAWSGFDGNELYLKLGATDAKGRRLFADGTDLTDRPGSSAVVGIKQSFVAAPRVRVGGLLQYASFGRYADERSIFVGSTQTLETVRIKSPWELQAALAASFVADWWAPYAGAAFSWRGFKAETIATVPAGSLKTSDSAFYREDGVAGALIGITLFGEKIRGDIEAQISKKISAGASINYLFP